MNKVKRSIQLRDYLANEDKGKFENRVVTEERVEIEVVDIRNVDRSDFSSQVGAVDFKIDEDTVVTVPVIYNNTSDYYYGITPINRTGNGFEYVNLHLADLDDRAEVNLFRNMRGIASDLWKIYNFKYEQYEPNDSNSCSSCRYCRSAEFDIKEMQLQRRLYCPILETIVDKKKKELQQDLADRKLSKSDMQYGEGVNAKLRKNGPASPDTAYKATLDSLTVAPGTICPHHTYYDRTDDGDLINQTLYSGVAFLTCWIHEKAEIFKTVQADAENDIKQHEKLVSTKVPTIYKDEVRFKFPSVEYVADNALGALGTLFRSIPRINQRANDRTDDLSTKMSQERIKKFVKKKPNALNQFAQVLANTAEMEDKVDEILQGLKDLRSILEVGTPQGRTVKSIEPSKKLAKLANKAGKEGRVEDDGTVVTIFDPLLEKGPEELIEILMKGFNDISPRLKGYIAVELLKCKNMNPTKYINKIIEPEKIIDHKVDFTLGGLVNKIKEKGLEDKLDAVFNNIRKDYELSKLETASLYKEIEEMLAEE